jgi:tetraacyldisaccharide 4'-kinase
MREPAFWWRGGADSGAAAALLAPAASLYGAIAAGRMARAGERAGVPVLCVGNFTLGGAGKTPAAIALARLLMAAGHRPFFLSRGYGGRLAGPILLEHDPERWVPVFGKRSCSTNKVERDADSKKSHPALGADAGSHSAREVGDEPLLLAKIAPTVVARDRPAGAAMAASSGADLVIMDDGLQNPSLAKDFSIAVVDGRRGIGNGRVFPAGPLRAPLSAQLDRVDALLVVGAATASSGRAIEAAQKRGLPVFHGELRPDGAAAASLAGKPVLAFAGIADPDKFFATLEACAIPAAVRARFPDHHRYTGAEMAALVARADRERLVLVTTEKDLARMKGDAAAAEILARARALPVTLTFAEPDAMARMLREAVQRMAGAAKRSAPP